MLYFYFNMFETNWARPGTDVANVSSAFQGLYSSVSRKGCTFPRVMMALNCSSTSALSRHCRTRSTATGCYTQSAAPRWHTSRNWKQPQSRSAGEGQQRCPSLHLSLIEYRREASTGAVKNSPLRSGQARRGWTNKLVAKVGLHWS